MCVDDKKKNDLRNERVRPYQRVSRLQESQSQCWQRRIGQRMTTEHYYDSVIIYKFQNKFIVIRTAERTNREMKKKTLAKTTEKTKVYNERTFKRNKIPNRKHTNT